MCVLLLIQILEHCHRFSTDKFYWGQMQTYIQMNAEKNGISKKIYIWLRHNQTRTYTTVYERQKGQFA